MADLAEMGYLQAVLSVTPANSRAPALYESAGWVAEGIERSAEVLGVVGPEVRYRTMLDPHMP
jgi:ribosomal protein S18 acetylase RimI-like enzyme